MADQKSSRQNVLLKSGMGTVAFEDYDEARHGPAVHESDEQYEARITGRVHPQRTVALRALVLPHTTTIASLATFDPATVSAPPAVVMPPPISSPPQGQRVAVETSDPTGLHGLSGTDAVTRVADASADQLHAFEAAEKAHPKFDGGRTTVMAAIEKRRQGLTAK